LASVSANIWLGTGAGEISYWKIRSGLEQGRRRMDNRCPATNCRSPDKTRHAICKYARVIRLEQLVLLRLLLGFISPAYFRGLQGGEISATLFTAMTKSSTAKSFNTFIDNLFFCTHMQIFIKNFLQVL